MGDALSTKGISKQYLQRSSRKIGRKKIEIVDIQVMTILTFILMKQDWSAAFVNTIIEYSSP